MSHVDLFPPELSRLGRLRAGDDLSPTEMIRLGEGYLDSIDAMVVSIQEKIEAQTDDAIIKCYDEIRS
ncbi:MAG: hypothetical protein KJ734_10400, partial [Chloroflexi bacterium]|nr:hypothetical protein [Chloroflexota bacterium]